MVYMPDGVYRKPVGDDRPATWYVIWKGKPGAEGSVIIGRTRRLRRHLYHRCFPEAGGAAEEIKGHVAGIRWLLKQHENAAAPAPD
jgi:hypothetical protein